jgi:glycosyltransferase involved in cell wall biosynthesis
MRNERLCAGPKKKKNFGLVINSKSSSGGIYQYSFLLIKALLQTGTANFHLTVICFHDDVLLDLESCFGEQLETLQVSRFHLKLHNILNFLIGGNKHLAKVGRLFSPLYFQTKKVDADIWFFPNQDSIGCYPDIPKVVFVHDIMHRYETEFPEVGGHFLRYYAREQRFKSISANASAIVVESQVGKRQFLESYNSNDDKFFILNYASTVSLPITTEIIVEEEFDKIPVKQSFFYPAQFWPHKNHHNLLIAMKKLHELGKKRHIIFSGHKEKEYHQLSRLTIDLGLENFVHFVGYRSRKEVAYLYSNCLAMVFPTFLGPTNMPPLEAISMGCPIAVSDIYAMPELLAQSALYFDPKSPDSIAGILVELEKEEVRHDLVKNGRILKHKFSVERFEDNFEKILAQLPGVV